ncbi:hypothetical protein QMO14_00035 [Variovorax sp. CAN2819]|uniref:hypothetical protein n=1 Tax=Variovorax sp. CAN15 TaxID=3046727 RepID=UPI002649B4DC|nr:hypothetical protein [Variovorax sp. CAN15]MDN6881972.1 hypothetical protein [Variovorax sp. CAN15]
MEACISGAKDIGPARIGGSNMGGTDAIKYQLQTFVVMFFPAFPFRIAAISSAPMRPMPP